MMGGGNIEKANARDRSAAGLILPSRVGEALQGGGHYGVSCWEPLPHERDLYIEIRDEILRLERNWQALLRAGGNRLVKLRKELAQFKMERRWSTEVFNSLVDAGINDALDKYLGGSSYTAAPTMGLVDGASAPTFDAANDTLASHAGWTENTDYSAGSRPSVPFGSASGGTKSTSSDVSYSMTADFTLAGCFVVMGGSTLLSEGAFTGGNQAGSSGSQINVSFDLSLTSA